MDDGVIKRRTVEMELCARQTVILPLLKFGCMFCMDIMKRRYKPVYKRKKVGVSSSLETSFLPIKQSLFYF